MTSHLSPDDLPWQALAGYLAGELSAEDTAELVRWIEAEPEREALVEELRQLWMAAGRLQPACDVEAALRRIKQAPAGPAQIIRLPRFYHDTPRSKRQRAGRVAIRVAATVAVVAGGTWALRHGPVAPRDPAPAVSEVATPRGQRASLRLPDGTQVMLGPASTFRHAVAADRGSRRVFLEGQAYFVVTHVPDRPFTLQTSHGVATDLGTRFGVTAYRADSMMDVVVAEGKVSLAPARDSLARRPPDDSLVLAPGDLGRVAVGGRVTAQRGIAVDRYLAWTEGRLEFRDTPLRDVIVQLGRWFDLDLRLGDSALGRKRVTASFQQESAPEVLGLLAASLELRIDHLGKVVVLRSK